MPQAVIAAAITTAIETGLAYAGYIAFEGSLAAFAAKAFAKHLIIPARTPAINRSIVQ